MSVIMMTMITPFICIDFTHYRPFTYLFLILITVISMMEFFLRKSIICRNMFIPVLYIIMKKSICKCQTLLEWVQNLVNPCSTWLNTLIQNLYTKKEIFLCYPGRNKQEEYEIISILLLQL